MRSNGTRSLAHLLTIREKKEKACCDCFKTRQSMRKMAKSLDISRETLRIVIKKDLDHYPYKLTKAKHLTQRMKDNRLEKAKRMRKFDSFHR